MYKSLNKAYKYVNIDDKLLWEERRRKSQILG